MTVTVTVAKGPTSPGVARDFASVETLFDELAAATPKVLEPDLSNKLEALGVIAATFDGSGKALSNLSRSSSACYLPFDLDDLPGVDTAAGKARLQALLHSMRAWESVCWTTAKSSRQGLRLRWLVALDEPLPNHDRRRWNRVFHAAAQALGIAKDYDANAADAVRWSLLPQTTPEHAASAMVLRFRGRKLSLTQLEAAAEVGGALDEARTATVTAARQRAEDMSRAEKHLERTLRTISKARTGERHATLNREVFKLAVRHAHVLQLENHVVPRVIDALKKADTDTAKPIDYGAGERTIRSAWDDGGQINTHDRTAWRGRLSRGESGAPMATLPNLAIVAECHEKLGPSVMRFDERRATIVLHEPPPWDPSSDVPRALTDVDATRFAVWVADELGIQSPTQGACYTALEAAAKRESFDPFREYLEGLTWDGVGRLDGWLHRHGGVEDTPLNTAFFSKWLIGAVARTFKPGCQMDTTLVFESKQGARKSTFLSILAGERNFLDALGDIGHKDAAQAVHGPVIIEFAELRDLTLHEVETVKAFLTRRWDKFRPPYGRSVVEIPRRCVFAASTNDTMYLRDGTGNRRFWPLACGRIDDVQAFADRDMLWAEATFRFHAGEQWWLDEELEALAAVAQNERRLPHPWEDALRAALRDAELLRTLATAGVWAPGQWDAEAKRVRWITLPQALRLMGMDRPRMPDAQMMAKVMQSLGCGRRGDRWGMPPEEPL